MKGFLDIKETAPVDFLSLNHVLMYSTRRSWCDAESSARTPCCWRMRMPLVLRCKNFRGFRVSWVIVEIVIVSKKNLEISRVWFLSCFGLEMYGHIAVFVNIIYVHGIFCVYSDLHHEDGEGKFIFPLGQLCNFYYGHILFGEDRFDILNRGGRKETLDNHFEGTVN
ncbi:hypothetical protein TNCV_2939351 [Trichonephila clavipes]|nr:hypothetical protein TNCV_2939351 [Trichonephila clavipes]